LKILKTQKNSYTGPRFITGPQYGGEGQEKWSFRHFFCQKLVIFGKFFCPKLAIFGKIVG
jgi:hypothetical protein